MDFGPVPNVGADGVGYQLFQAMAQYLNQQAPDRPAPDRPAPDRTAHDRTETEHQCCLPRRLKIFLIILLSLGIPAAIGGIFSTMHPGHGDSVTKVLNGTEQVTYVAWDGVMMSALSNFCLLIVTAVLVIYWLFLIGFIATLFNDMKTANTTQTQWKRIRRAKIFLDLHCNLAGSRVMVDGRMLDKCDRMAEDPCAIPCLDGAGRAPADFRQQEPKQEPGPHPSGMAEVATRGGPLLNAFLRTRNGLFVGHRHSFRLSLLDGTLTSASIVHYPS